MLFLSKKKKKREDGARSKVHKIQSPLKVGHTFGSKLSRNQYKEEIAIKFVIHSTHKAKANQLLRRSMFILDQREISPMDPHKNDTMKYIETHPQRKKNNPHSKPSKSFISLLLIISLSSKW